MRFLLAVVAFLGLFAPAVAQQTAPDVDPAQLMMPGPMGDFALGDPNAPVQIIEYASLTCPHCQRFHSETFPTLKSNYIDTGKAHFILRGFPLNSLDIAATMLARCTGKDHFYDVIDTLFDNQNAWAYVNDPVSALIAFLQPYGINQQTFADCINRQDVFDHVDTVAETANKTFDVTGTPTFFFNGYQVVGEISVDDLNNIMGQLLGSAAGTGGHAPSAIPGGGAATHL